MAEEEIESGIYEMCDMLLLTKEVSIKKYRAELAIMMSCKRSIKANHRIDDHSARQLLYQLSQCDNPYNCPHGTSCFGAFHQVGYGKDVPTHQEITPVSVSWGNIKLKGKLCTNI